MINRNSNHNYTQLTICNYDTYQDQGTTEGTTEGTSKGQLKDNQRTLLKNVKNLKNEKELNMSGTVKPYPDRVDNYFNNIPDHLRKAFVEAYPNIDIDYQLKRAKTWLLVNPNRANELINYNNLVVILVTLVIQKHIVYLGKMGSLIR